MIVGVIPARLESTRFPHKILFPINNRPMLAHVYDRAIEARKLDKVIVAVDSSITKDVLRDYGIDVVMTSAEHQSGTDRIAEAVKSIDYDVVINLQADEPYLDPNLIDILVDSFIDDEVKIVTLASTIITNEHLIDENTVKVSIDDNGFAKGFYRQVSENDDYLRHIGIYGYRRDILEKFTELPQSDNEKRFKLEQLRAMDNGIPIKIIECDYKYNGIDTPEDLKQFEQFADTGVREDQ